MARNPDARADGTPLWTLSEFKPNPRHHATYQKLYAEYRRLHDYAGRGENNVMQRLREIQSEQSASSASLRQASTR